MFGHRTWLILYVDHRLHFQTLFLLATKLLPYKERYRAFHIPRRGSELSSMDEMLVPILGFILFSHLYFPYLLIVSLSKYWAKKRSLK